LDFWLGTFMTTKDVAVSTADPLDGLPSTNGRRTAVLRREATLLQALTLGLWLLWLVIGLIGLLLEHRSVPPPGLVQPPDSPAAEAEVTQLTSPAGWVLSHPCKINILKLKVN
jgi:hypothetical protein